MSAVKTAISLEERLLSQIDAAAEELELPRSRVLAMAAEEFLRRRESARLLAELNAAYGDENDDMAEEKAWRQRAKPHHRRLVEGEW